MLATHVDDLMWTADPGYEHKVRKVLETFDIRKIEQDEFRFCGREVKQNSKGDISVSCKSTTESILPINFQRNGRKNADKATDSEVGQLRSVVGSLAWICRQCRPELSYAVSRLQSMTTTANVGVLTFANKVLEEAKTSVARGLTYPAGLLNWEKSILVTISDASFASETRHENGRTMPRRMP